MKISLDWLGEFVAFTEKDPHAIAERLTLSTAEVEDVIRQGIFLDHCCVGEILSIDRHPNADKLSLVTVQTDKGPKKVVCGGTNLSMGMKIAFAHVGATVKWHGNEVMTLEPVTIRGQESHGMICAAEELGIESLYPAHPEDGERPIVDLGNLTTGQDLRAALGMTDVVFDVNNTAITTRPDLWSHVGMARECIALQLGKQKAAPAHTAVKFSKAPLPFKTVIDAKKLVSRYQACILDIDALGETPAWMKKRLESTGWECINLPVDITNYVAMELGIPLHAFDADSIKGTVHFRTAKKGESIVTLDGTTRSLPEGGLILSDDNGVFDLMGIMGGMQSGTTEKTRRIFLHAAAVDPIVIRQTIQATGLRTHAATVYEKGVPPVVVELGLRRALELFLELVPGARIASKLEEWGTNGKAPAIKLPVATVTSVLGFDIPQQKIASLLASLECTVKQPPARSKKSATAVLTVTPPLHRLRDLAGPHDLIEEIARLHGYENIPNTAPRGALRPVRSRSLEQRLTRHLAADGFVHILPLSLVGPDLVHRSGMDPIDSLAIANPLTDELSLLQPSTLPQLLDHARRNQLLTDTIRTFHCAHVFAPDGSEHSECGILLMQDGASLRTDPFLILLERVTHCLRTLGHTPSIERDPAPEQSMHPGRSAIVRIGSSDIARVFDVRPSVLAQFDLRRRTSAALMDLAALGSHVGQIARSAPLPAHPAISYDITVRRAQENAIGPLLAKIRGASPLLESVDVRDLYDGAGISKGSYNVTLRFTYRAPNRTLTDAEATKEHAALLAAHALVPVS